MGGNTMRTITFKLPLYLIALIGLIPLQTIRVHAQDKILFLRFRMRDDSITIVQSNIRAGFLKPIIDAGKAGGIEYQCRSSVGSLISRGIIDDPSSRRYEFEDPDQPGRLKVKVVSFNDVKFTLRIRFEKEISRIEFYRIRIPEPSSRLQKKVKVFLGSVNIHPNGGGR
jgi:hypothetical protein